MGFIKGYTMTDEHKTKIAKALKGRPKSLEARQNMSRADKGRIAWNKGMQMSEEYRAICRASHGGNIPWNKGLTKETDSRVADYLIKQMGARNIQPNKPESVLIDIIERYGLPFKYVGDGQFILGYKCPDFLNINGKKQLIELFGTYWHSVFDVAARKEHFKQYGFQTLIIWEDELKVLPEADIVKRIRKFSLRKEAKK